MNVELYVIICIIFQSVPLATSPKPLSSKISFELVRVPVHFNVH